MRLCWLRIKISIKLSDLLCTKTEDTQLSVVCYTYCPLHQRKPNNTHQSIFTCYIAGVISIQKVEMQEGEWIDQDSLHIVWSTGGVVIHPPPVGIVPCRGQEYMAGQVHISGMCLGGIGMKWIEFWKQVKMKLPKMLNSQHPLKYL